MFKHRPHLFALVACALIGLFSAAQAGTSRADGPRAEDPRDLLARIERERDQVPLEVIESLGAIGTRASAEALIAAYDELSSILTRRAVLEALAGYDGVADCEQLALQKITDVAVGSKVSELRDFAIDRLAGCESLGRFFLRNIVDSQARSVVRERAMKRHVETTERDTDDLDWYEQVFEIPSGSDARPGKGQAPATGRPLGRVRELALEQIAPTMSDNRLVELARQKRRDMTAPPLAGIRRIALAELFARGSKKAKGVAEDVFKDVTEPAENRIAAARHLYAESGTKLASRFLSEGDRDRSVVPMALKMALADILADMDHPSTKKKLVSMLKKSEGDAALFCLRALRGFEDKRLASEVLKLAGSEQVAVRVAAIEALGSGTADRVDAVEALEAILAAESDERVLVSVLDALGQLRAGDPSWPESLLELTGDGRAELRNAALQALANAAGSEHLETFARALSHEDWSTRVTALLILTEQRSREATGAIIDRMGDEEDFMLDRFADALWSLSGKPFRRSADRWARWWQDVGATFEPISDAELAALAAEEERRRLAESTKAASFFGLRVESKRVLFVLDVSGSMAFPLTGERDEDEEEDDDEGGPEEVRMDVAKDELVAALTDLDADTLFNLIVFSSGVGYWQDGGIVEATPSRKDEAIEFVGRLGAGGGTNLYGALQVAFSDRDVDTIFVLSDGEPAGGKIDDPYVIREEVAAWNEHRHITIHTVAIGGDLGVLEWLAEDSGGWYVKYE